MAIGGELATTVPRLLLRGDHVDGVELRGSRVRGTAGRFSDWDFSVATSDFASVAGHLPGLVSQLDPLVRQWDRLSDTPCYMLIVRGPTKIDLIFEGIPHTHEPPWVVGERTLPAVDHHFWDWTLWLASKVDAGRRQMVSDELKKMHSHLLAPMGVREQPALLGTAVDQYLKARGDWELRLGIDVDREPGDAVRRIVALLGE